MVQFRNTLGHSRCLPQQYDGFNECGKGQVDVLSFVEVIGVLCS